MLPLANALLCRGHKIGWCTSPDALPELDGLSLDRFAVGLSMLAARKAYRERWPHALTLRGEALSGHTFPHLFGAVIAPAMIDDLESVVSRWRPDLVINEVAAFAAPLVCERWQIRNITHGYGLRPPATQLADAMREFGPWWEADGTPAPHDGGLFRHLYLDITPASLGRGPDVDCVAVQLLSPASPRTANRKKIQPALHRQLVQSSKAKVYLSFGTVFNQGDGLRVAAEALASLELDVVITVGHDGDIGRLAGLPTNVHIERFIDQDELLPLCNAVVSHAGAGTVLGAAVHGLPQLLLPQAADQFRNARAIVTLGAGRLIMPDEISHESVVSAMRDIRNSDEVPAVARQLAHEIALMPTADDVASSLENL
jgi:hypothetical protein